MLASFYEAPLAYLFVLATVICSARAMRYRSFFESWCMHPYSIYRGRRVFTLFSSALIHGDWRHLAVTVLLLVVGMPEIEYMLVDDFGSLQGRLLFLFAITFTTLFAGVLSVLQFRNRELHWSSGGSPLCYSMAMLYLVYLPVDPLSGLPVFLQSWLPVWLACLIFAILIVLVLFGDPAGAIHLYGALAGILLAFIARPQAMEEIVVLFSSPAGLEKSDDPATGNNQATDQPDDDSVKDSSLAAFAADYGF